MLPNKNIGNTNTIYHCLSFLLSLPICMMYYIGCLSLSGYNIVLLCWSPGVSFDVPPLTFVISAAQCRFWQRVGFSILLRGVSLGLSCTFSYYAAKGFFGCGPIGIVLIYFNN